MDLIQLQSFLNQNEIPIAKQNFGFLEIIKKAHNETINSAIYAHFLSSDDPTIKQAFLSALLAIIEIKTDKKLHFHNPYASTELPTDEGRIDIVIKDLIEPSTIIIENKLYHWLHNNLKEYWTFFKINDCNKAGVLLTLEPHGIQEEVKEHFINITHWEWVKNIKDRLDFDEVKDETNIIYLNDFFNTIERLSTTYKMNTSAKFFFEHAAQVNKANHTLIEGHKFMLDQYRLIASILGLETYGSDINWVNIWDESNILDTYLTITTHDIISGNGYRYRIILELNRNDRDKVDAITAQFKDHPKFKDKDRGQSKDTYIHFLVKEYEITPEELNVFADHVVKNIVKDFGEIFIEIIKCIHPEKNIENWKQNFLKS
ncbi:hypothetical protein D778_02712 [Xanthomarina gelatinilytica]|uniref:PD-(D/E)XK nuclease family protein n=1 Tax=Xanthomarina gelatinilytica TaxID=1137281 RepID=M7MJE5_9FLAO|nr:PD-(D/E)XK nuclease family protein [Xanthomarina gelatinilytica]EMQ95191.1 hypothetical protein D778_02712 [Xanthomarina gelatinilytica]